MKKLAISLTTAALLSTATSASAFWGNDGWGGGYNPYDEWDPRYWMEEMFGSNNGWGGPWGGNNWGGPWGGNNWGGPWGGNNWGGPWGGNNWGGNNWMPFNGSWNGNQWGGGAPYGYAPQGYMPNAPVAPQVAPQAPAATAQ